MAEVVVEGGELHVRLRPLERLAAFHGDVTVPLASVDEVRVLERALDALRGVRAPGTGVPGWLSIGTRRGAFGRDFVSIVGRGRGVAIVLRDSTFKQIVVSVDDPEAIRARVPVTASRA